MTSCDGEGYNPNMYESPQTSCNSDRVLLFRNIYLRKRSTLANQNAKSFSPRKFCLVPIKTAITITTTNFGR